MEITSLPLASLWEVINFVDYSLDQGAPAGHESAETPIGHESNGVVAKGSSPKDQHSHQGRQDNLNEFRSMRDRMHPPRMSAPSCIVPPTEQLVIRPYLVPLLPTFHGMESENPYAHIKEFEDVCNTFQEGGASIDLMRLKLFPFTLKDKAKIWLNSLRPRTKENEKFYECWERYMEAINACPHHGFDTWLLVSYFYDGMSSSMKQLLETMCGGDFMSKNPEEAMDFLSYVAEAGMYTLKEDDDMKAKLAAVTRRLEELELKKVHEVQAVAEAPVQLEESSKFLMEGQSNSVPTVRINHLNNLQVLTSNSKSQQGSGRFCWKPRSHQCSINQRIDRVESTLNKMMDGMQNDISQKFDNLQYSISRLTNLNTVQEKGRFPSQPHQNPKGVHEVESLEGESSQMKDVKALITLRSGKKIEKPTPKPHVEKEEEIKKGRKWKTKRYKDREVLPFHHDWRKGSGESFVRLGSKCEFASILCLKQLGLDFIVLDTDPTIKEANLVPIILGRPFLATSNAIINCRNGLMQLTFGNMTLDLNIFYMSKKQTTPEEEEDKLNESLVDFEEGLSEPPNVLATLQSWRMIEEILPLFNKEEEAVLKKRLQNSI
ncbi:hypothetical protein CK203_037213 [Vitis vinifera]|uniref:Retrotransposon gag domain-containing protein n=1 Tax=Vitis vinifera TaxID=29760 RepID=A0A438HS53_VITVI|nr:hypothetical protein CK203_037213 [Vitis vinifera]